MITSHFSLGVQLANITVFYVMNQNVYSHPLMMTNVLDIKRHIYWQWTRILRRYRSIIQISKKIPCSCEIHIDVIIGIYFKFPPFNGMSSLPGKFQIWCEITREISSRTLNKAMVIIYFVFCLYKSHNPFHDKTVGLVDRKGPIKYVYWLGKRRLTYQVKIIFITETRRK